MQYGDGFILCFCITDHHSFLECEENRNIILKVREQDNVPIILVANKVDLRHGMKKSVGFLPSCIINVKYKLFVNLHRFVFCLGTSVFASSLSTSRYGSYQRKVLHEEATALSNKFGCPYIETSAAHRKHVDDVFHTIVREIKRHRVISLIFF